MLGPHTLVSEHLRRIKEYSKQLLGTMHIQILYRLWGAKDSYSTCFSTVSVFLWTWHSIEWDTLVFDIGNLQQLKWMTQWDTEKQQLVTGGWKRSSTKCMTQYHLIKVHNNTKPGHGQIRISSLLPQWQEGFHLSTVWCWLLKQRVRFCYTLWMTRWDCGD